MQANVVANSTAAAPTTTAAKTTSSSTINNNRKTQVVGSSINNNKNNHFSNSNKLLASAAATTTTAMQNGISGSLSSGNPKNLLNHHQQNQQQQHSMKRLSILNTNKHLPDQQQQQIYQLQPFPPPSMLHQTNPRSSLGSASPHFSYTLQNNKTTNNKSPQAFYHNSLKAKDLKVLKLSLARDHNGDKDDDDDDDSYGGENAIMDDILADNRGDEDSDYYMPSSLEILGIQKALENLEKSVGKTVDDDDGDNDDLEAGDNLVVQSTIMANDFETTKNATNSLLKLQQQKHENREYEQQQQPENDEQNITKTTTTTTTNRLWYH
uniref:Uncharacterized protein n=1 Tax=Musca domestica TaxID=7370 RepID=A0A1I8NJT4_MUSDO